MRHKVTDYKKQQVLKLFNLGIILLESVPFGLLDNEDKSSLEKLWKHHDEFEAVLK